MIGKWLLVSGLLIAAGAPAFAQTTPSNPCSEGRATVGEGSEITAPNTNKNQSLSEHLAQSGGVICPPENVDPEIKAPTPQGGKMPVIPPPGTPQNQPNVQPK
jgi:hypothetical protein